MIIQETFGFFAQKSGPKCCDKCGDVETILFLEIEILDVSNVRNDNASERERRTENRSDQQIGLR